MLNEAYSYESVHCKALIAASVWKQKLFVIANSVVITLVNEIIQPLLTISRFLTVLITIVRLLLLSAHWINSFPSPKALLGPHL